MLLTYKIDVPPYETSRSVYSLLQICYRCAGRSADKLQIICRMFVEYLQNICRISAECLQSVSSYDLQQVCKFADALQTKSAYHVKQRAHKMHQSNNVYLKDRQRRPVCYSSKVNITRTKMLGDTRAIKSLPDKRY